METRQSRNSWEDAACGGGENVQGERGQVRLRLNVRAMEGRVARMQTRAERQLRTKHNNTRTERVVRCIRHSWEKDRKPL